MKEYTGLILLIASIIFILCGIGMLVQNMSRNSFNRCTGSNVSFWDGQFMDFRVTDCPNLKKGDR